MTRGRKKAEEEAYRERIEGAMAALGNGRVYARLVRERIALAGGDDEYWSLAISDMLQIEQLMIKAQAIIKAML